MASNYETFWENDSFAVIGHEARKNFPVLTYQGLKKLGKTVYAVDPSVKEIDGDRSFSDLGCLPESVEAAVIEVPKEETAAWVREVAKTTIRDVWIHMGRDTPEALALAEQNGLNVRSGTCAVMYVSRRFTYHSIHKWIMKAAGRF